MNPETPNPNPEKNGRESHRPAESDFDGEVIVLDDYGVDTRPKPNQPLSESVRKHLEAQRAKFYPHLSKKPPEDS